MSNREATLKAKALVDAFGQLAGNGKVALQKKLGETAIAQAALGIRQSVNPYGDPFEALRSRTGIPLRRTGNNIQRSWTAGQATAVSFVFGNRFKYLATHQYGVTIIPKRVPLLRFSVENAPKRTKSGRWKSGGSRVVYALKVVIPRRQMVPEMDTGGLGPRWTKAFERTIRAHLRGLFSPAGGQ